MELVEFKGDKYPLFQSFGNASQFAIPFALHMCKGKGYDIGFGKEEWKFPGAIGVDSVLNDGFDANILPDEEMDYIYSSHCLEHVDNWIETLELWIDKLKKGGILFLYLPDFSQKYWRPWNNRKHLHCFTPNIIQTFLTDKNMKNIFVTGVDLNNSFMCVCEK
jgi:predicted SAM-dependent methyltransferase